MDDPTRRSSAAQDAELISLRLQQHLRRQYPAGTGPGFLIFFPPASESGEDESDLVGFVSPILEPVLYSHSISGLVGRGLKGGQRHSGCNCGRVPSGFWRLSCWRRHRNKVGRSWTHWTSQRHGEITLRKGGRIFCRINPRGTWKTQALEDSRTIIDDRSAALKRRVLGRDERTATVRGSRRLRAKDGGKGFEEQLRWK